MSFDFFIETLSLAFEYQGEQHYKESYIYEKQGNYIERDEMKMKACFENDIKLIQIPYWWDRSVATLAATINDHLPGLVQVPFRASPIPPHPTKKLLVDHQLQKWRQREVREHLRKEYFDWIGKALCFETPEEWYGVNVTQISELGRKHVEEDVDKLVMHEWVKNMMPEMKWIGWLFQSPLSWHFWSSRQNVCDFLEHISSVLHIKKMQDWARVMTKQIEELGGSGIFTIHTNWINVLRFAFPHSNMNWEDLRASYGKLASQQCLLKFMGELFPMEERNGNILFKQRTEQPEITF